MLKKHVKVIEQDKTDYSCLSLSPEQITPGGKAAKGGLRFNDYILAINGDSTESLLHSDAMMLIKTTGLSLVLKLSHDPPKSPQVQTKFGGYEETDQSTSTGDRPRPPPPPSNVVAAPPPVQPPSSASITTTPKRRKLIINLWLIISLL